MHAASREGAVQCEMLRPALQLGATLGLAAAHSSLLRPPCRNSLDARLPRWRTDPFFMNATANGQGGDNWGCDCVNGSSPCLPGQACMWYTQGTTIGCAKPDGGPSNPNVRDRCGSGMKATLNDPALRTANIHAPAGSAADVYKFNPWR